MEFTKGMTVRSKNSNTIIAVTQGNVGTFQGVAIHGKRKGEFRFDWVNEAFHPFDLQSAIEEALKNEKV